MVQIDLRVLVFLFPRLIPGGLVVLVDLDFLLDPVVLDRLVDPLALVVLLNQKVLGLLKDPKDQQDQDDLLTGNTSTRVMAMVCFETRSIERYDAM